MCNRYVSLKAKLFVVFYSPASWCQFASESVLRTTRGYCTELAICLDWLQCRTIGNTPPSRTPYVVAPTMFHQVKYANVRGSRLKLGDFIGDLPVYIPVLPGSSTRRPSSAKLPADICKPPAYFLKKNGQSIMSKYGHTSS